MRCYLISGEASGDLHAGNLVGELKAIDPTFECRAWGGQHLIDSGADVVKHYRETAFMGLVAVLKNLGKIRKLFKFCKKDILDYNPDFIILVDYPGFNLRIAKWARKHNITVLYFISPQIWAWKERRIHKIKRDIDQMFVIIPFEVQFYSKHNLEVHYEGHPLPEIIDHYKTEAAYNEDKPILSLFPGSRKQEIVKMLPEMLNIYDEFADQFKFVIACAPGINSSFYSNLLNKYPDIFLEKISAYNLLSQSSIALVTSGTATLETALFGVPQIVCYKTSGLTYQIAKRVIKVPYISIVNLILDSPLLTELIQQDLNSARLSEEIKLLKTENKKAQIQNAYKALRLKFGEEGVYKRLARKMLTLVQ